MSPPPLPSYFPPKVTTSADSTWMPRQELRQSGREERTRRQHSCTRALKLFFVDLMLVSLVRASHFRWMWKFAFSRVLLFPVINSYIFCSTKIAQLSSFLPFISLSSEAPQRRVRRDETKTPEKKWDSARKRGVKWQPLLTAAHSWISCQSALPAGEIPNGVYLHMLSVQNVRYDDL